MWVLLGILVFPATLSGSTLHVVIKNKTKKTTGHKTFSLQVILGSSSTETQRVCKYKKNLLMLIKSSQVVFYCHFNHVRSRTQWGKKDHVFFGFMFLCKVEPESEHAAGNTRIPSKSEGQ